MSEEEEFSVHTSLSFNNDGTVNITFENVNVDDVDFLFWAVSQEEFQDNFITGLTAAVGLNVEAG